MTTTRIVEETPCEHGEQRPHDAGCGHNCGYTPKGYQHGAHWWCPGGYRRVLTEGQYVLIEKVDGEWPLPISINRLYWGDGAPVDVDEMLDYFADALSDHTEGET